MKLCCEVPETYRAAALKAMDVIGSADKYAKQIFYRYSIGDFIDCLRDYFEEEFLLPSDNWGRIIGVAETAFGVEFFGKNSSSVQLQEIKTFCADMLAYYEYNELSNSQLLFLVEIYFAAKTATIGSCHNFIDFTNAKALILYKRKKIEYNRE